MSGELPPLYSISLSSRAGYPIISTAVCVCITGLTIAIRLILGWQHKTAVAWDDISFGIAAVRWLRPFKPPVALTWQCQVLVISSLALYPFAVQAGLGRHVEDLDKHSIDRFYKVRVWRDDSKVYPTLTSPFS
jgi:hypothetical protein